MCCISAATGPSGLPLLDYGGRGDLLPFWGAVFDAHFPPLHILPLRRHPSRRSAPHRPPPPPSSLINSRLHEGKQLISPTKVTVTWAPASGGYLPAANERRRGKVREKNKGEGKGGGGRKGGAVQGSSFYRL